MTTSAASTTVRGEKASKLLDSIKGWIEYYEHQEATTGYGGEIADEQRATALRGVVRDAEAIRALMEEWWMGFSKESPGVMR